MNPATAAPAATIRRARTNPAPTFASVGRNTWAAASARITYPSGSQASLLIKLLDSQNGVNAASATVNNSTEVSGSASSGAFCGSVDRYTVFFDMVSDPDQGKAARVTRAMLEMTKFDVAALERAYAAG